MRTITDIALIRSLSQCINQIIEHSTRSFFQTITIMSTAVLEKTSPKKPMSTDTIPFSRTFTNKPLSLSFKAPGFILGLIPGFMGFLFMSGWRMLSNCAISLDRSATYILDLAFEHPAPKENDHRTPLAKGLGLPGWLLGILPGVIGFLLIGFTKIIFESALSFKDIAVKMIMFAIRGIIVSSEDERTPFAERLGLPGLFLGMVIGSIGFAATSIIKMFFLSVRACIDTTRQIAAMALEKRITTSLAKLEPEPPQQGTKPFSFNLVLSMPGYLVGIIPGLMGAFIIGLGRIIINSVYTAGDLSGSFINVGLERHVFDGLASKKAFHARWVWGLPGLLLALPALSIALSIMICRKLVPLVLNLMASPLVATWRIAYEYYKYKHHLLRFSAIENDVVKTFKLFFANLTPMGNLPGGRILVDRCNDSPIYTKGWINPLLKFLRKVLTFNEQSITEKLLSLSLSEYRKKLQIVNVNDSNEDNTIIHVYSAINTAADQLNAATSSASHWIRPDSEKEQINKEITNIRDFLDSVFIHRFPISPDPTISTITPSTAVPPSENKNPILTVPTSLYPGTVRRIRGFFTEGRYENKPMSKTSPAFSF